MGSYVVGAYLAGAAPEYCLRGWKLVMRLSRAYTSHRHAYLADMYLSQAYISHRHASLVGMHLSQACLSHRNVSLTGIHLS
jgi:hypothetical protein